MARPPREGDAPLFSYRPFYQYSTFAIIALVLLRLAVGWHFFREGSQKITDGKFSSTGFLSAAKGPFAPLYKNMIYDADGVYRLDAEATSEQWAAFRDQAVEHYGFDDKQQKKADEVFKRFDRQLRAYIGANAEDINEYFRGLERRDTYSGLTPDEDEHKRADNVARTEVPSLRGQLGTIESDLKKKVTGWLRNIDNLWASYEREINDIATQEQGSELRLVRVGRRTLDSVTVDRYLPYFDLTIGILLVLGLFTRAASLAAAAFLGSVVLTQWPWAPDAAPIFYQTVELCALLVLAGTAAGRFAGLDFFLYVARLKCCPPKQESTHATHA